MNQKYFSLLATAASLIGPSLPAVAQDHYPNRSIRMVVPYTLGGITDVVRRICEQEPTKAFNQNILVDNRPGANSILGA